jgi:hypothetical protein
LELTGTITDGDDHNWVGDSAVLGGNGNWREVLAGPSERLLKREFDEVGDGGADELLEDGQEEAVIYSLVDDPDDEQVRFPFLLMLAIMLILMFTNLPAQRRNRADIAAHGRHGDSNQHHPPASQTQKSNVDSPDGREGACKGCERTCE